MDADLGLFVFWSLAGVGVASMGLGLGAYFEAKAKALKSSEGKETT